MNMMNGDRQQVFADERLDRLFDYDGYLVVNLLEEAEVDELLALYNSVDSKVPLGYYTSLWSPDEEYRYKVNREIIRVVEQKAKALFVDHSPLFADFIVKRTGEFSGVGIHQDWMLVEEPKYTSFFVWCPLVDVGDTNGAMEMVKRSHLFDFRPRGANITLPCHIPPLSEHIVKNFLTPVYLKKGQAFIFNHNVIHRSKPNLSDKDRPVAATVMVHDKADIFHYHWKQGNDMIEKIKVPRDFYLNYNYYKDFVEKLETQDITRPPGGEVVELIPHKFVPISNDDFDTLYYKYNPIAETIV